MATDKWFVYIKISLGVVINYTAAKCRRSFGIDVQNPGSDNWIIEFVPLVRKSIGWNCLTPVKLPTFSSFYSTLSNDFVATLIERNRLIIYAAEYIRWKGGERSKRKEGKISRLVNKLIIEARSVRLAREWKERRHDDSAWQVYRVITRRGLDRQEVPADYPEEDISGPPLCL